MELSKLHTKVDSYPYYFCFQPLIILFMGCIVTVISCNNEASCQPFRNKKKPGVTDNKDYKLVWSDEFNYSGMPDSSKWSFETGNNGWGNNELEYYTNRTKNAVVRDSMLIITARKENYKGSDYTSARLITYQSDNFWKYGRIEARIKVPKGQGIWPAFWMLGKSIDEGTAWPASGEIDIMEMIGGGTNNHIVHGTAHWQDGGHKFYGKSYNDESKLSDSFHIYAIEWNKKYIKWYFDNHEYCSVSINEPSMEEFHAPFFILLNVAVGGNWPGNPDNSTVFSQKMKVDYVRVYQK